MEHYPIIKGQFNSYYDYNKIFELQRVSVEGKIDSNVQKDKVDKKYSDLKTNKSSKGPSLILRNTPRPSNRHK